MTPTKTQKHTAPLVPYLARPFGHIAVIQVLVRHPSNNFIGATLNSHCNVGCNMLERINRGLRRTKDTVHVRNDYQSSRDPFSRPESQTPAARVNT